MRHAKNYINLYSMKWDEELGKLAKELAYKGIDLNSPNAISLKVTPSPMYKVGRNAIAMLDYYRLTDDEYLKKVFMKMIDYDFRFGGAKPDDPIGYQDASGMMLSVAYLFSGKEKYFRRAYQTVKAGIDSEKASSSMGTLPYYTQCLNYQACLNMPVILKVLSEYKGRLDPVPMLIKNLSATSNAWAAFKKANDKPVVLEMEVEPADSPDVQLIVIGPDMKQVNSMEITAKEKRMVNPFEQSATPYYLEVKLPAGLPEGTYRLGHNNPGPFTVIDANVKKMVLECPDGFWTREYASLYFNVPEGTDAVKIFTQLPVSIKRSDGSPAKSPDGKESGELTLPVEGKHGFWTIESDIPAYVKFLNLPNITACLDKERFFIPEKLMEKEGTAAVLPKPEETFVAGVIGNALQLNGKDGIKVARGAKLEDGTYENFPRIKGTVEFYFRPNWSAVDISLPEFRPLLDAGGIELRYRYWHTYAQLDLLCGQSRFKERGRIDKYGNNARYFPKAGEWVHIAATWNAEDTVKYDEHKNYGYDYEVFQIFINGKKFMRCTAYPRRLCLYGGKSFADNFEIPELSEWITIGPGNGTFDELRVSDIVRYENDFVPPNAPFVPDKNTRLLMHFDDSVAGLDKNGKNVEIEYKAVPAGNKSEPEIKLWRPKPVEKTDETEK